MHSLISFISTIIIINLWILVILSPRLSSTTNTARLIIRRPDNYILFFSANALATHCATVFCEKIPPLTSNLSTITEPNLLWDDESRRCLHILLFKTARQDQGYCYSCLTNMNHPSAVGGGSIDEDSAVGRCSGASRA